MQRWRKAHHHSSIAAIKVGNKQNYLANWNFYSDFNFNHSAKCTNKFCARQLTK